MESSSPLTYFLAFIIEIKLAFFYSLRRELSKYCIKLTSFKIIFIISLLSSIKLLSSLSRLRDVTPTNGSILYI